MHKEKTSLTVPARLLQAILVLVGFAALAFLLVEPHFEGRNVHATPFQIYFRDPFLAYAYLASLPFFVALYKTFRVAGAFGRGTLVSFSTVKALATVRRCAFLLIGFTALGELLLLMTESDDRAGAVVIGLVIILGSLLVAWVAGRARRGIEKSLRAL
jgi:hypothetical protein